MGIISRLINRIRFRRTIKKDESSNVVDGIVRARLLYKKLSIIAHPDKNPDKRAEAEDIMARITTNRLNYAKLLLLEQEVNERLLSKSDN